MKNKRGAAGETIIMVYRIVLIIFIALVIIGSSAVFYQYYINVRDVEAFVFHTKIINCIAPNGMINYTELNGKDIISYCGINQGKNKRIYVKISIADTNNVEIGVLQGGDSGLSWMEPEFTGQKQWFERKGIFENTKYAVGYAGGAYYFTLIKDEKRSYVYVTDKVIIKNEF